MHQINFSAGRNLYFNIFKRLRLQQTFGMTITAIMTRLSAGGERNNESWFDKLIMTDYQL